MSLLFNMLSRLVIAFLPRRKRLLISWMQSSVILEPEKIKSVTLSTASPSTCHEVMGLDAMILVSWMLSFKPTFSFSSFTKRLCSSSLLYAIRVVSSAHLRLLIFLPATLIQACASSSPAFLMMYSAYEVNKWGENTQPWRTPPNFKPVHCLMYSSKHYFLTCTQISQKVGKVVWYSHLLKNFP